MVVEHGTFGARAAAPIARDVLTYLFDPAKAWDGLLAMEKEWGGTPSERMAAKYQAYAAQYGTSAPKVGDDQEVQKAIISADNTEAPVDSVGTTPDTVHEEPPSPPPGPQSSPAPGAGPAPSPTPAANNPAQAAN